MPEQPARRTLIKRLTWTCAGAVAGLLGARAWQSTAPVEPASALLLARRVVRLIGPPAPGALPALAQPADEMAQQLVQLCGVPDCAAALALNDAQLKQRISMRIQQQYQQGAVVRHHGWWLARSEVLLLQLGAS